MAEESATVEQDKGISASSSKRGFFRFVNQDRAMVVSPFLLEGEAGSNNFVIGVFDGHGDEGEHWAEFASNNFPSIFSSLLKQQPRPWDAAKVTDTFTTTFRRLHEEGPAGEESGSTASVALRLGDMLYLANVGDSVTFVALYDAKQRKACIIRKTAPHKPDVPCERARIEEHGATVYIGKNGLSSRVIMNGERLLAMSRSLGDRYLSSSGVIPDPTVIKVSASIGNDVDVLLFVVSATDGLFDMVPLESIAHDIGRFVSAKSSDRLKEGCDSLVKEADNRWRSIRNSDYGDDVTIAVHVL